MALLTAPLRVAEAEVSSPGAGGGPQGRRGRLTEASKRPPPRLRRYSPLVVEKQKPAGRWAVTGGNGGLVVGPTGSTECEGSLQEGLRRQADRTRVAGAGSPDSCMANVSPMESTTGRAWAGAAIALVVVTSIINLPLPFFGDQALYSVMASMMGDGAALYADVWDIKQPGIFVFYLAGGTAFGYTEVGIHIFEILWWSAFMVVLSVTIRRIVTSPIAVAATIGLIGGTYFLVASPTELTQVEGLVGFPMFLCLWFAYRSESSGSDGRRLLVLSGVFGGVVLIFKLIFLPVVAALWLISALGRHREGGIGLGTAVGSVAAGLALPLGLVVIVLAVQGALDEAIRTSLVYPFEVLAVDGIGYGFVFLRRNVTWFAVMFLPVHVLAVLGMWRAIRGERRTFDRYAMAWLVTGTIVIVVQVSSWFTWHFLLLLVPMGLFAGRGVDWIVMTWPDFTRWVRFAFALVAVAALIPPLYGGAVKVGPLVANGFALSEAQRQAFEFDVWPYYRDFRTDGAILDDSLGHPGPIYVFGDPTYNFLFGRDQAIPVHGWTPQLLTDDVWNRVTDDLVAARPSFIHVAEWTRRLVETRSPGIAAFLASEYEIVRRSELGVWYVLNG